MRHDSVIALAIPGFFLFIAIEALAARARGLRAYRFADTIADLGCGITQRMFLLAVGGALGVGYVWIYAHARVADLGRRPLLAWSVAFLGVDFIYYWWHRASHRVNLLWAGHVVHHQSEEFNLAVALRQSILTPFTHLPFSLTLAVVGVPPAITGTCGAVSTLYQFFIHTRTIGRLGPLEAVLNTPSHHRVHHGRDPEYLDRNYGAMLIIWDRLFGTFATESRPPTYGITTPLRSFNPLLAQVHYLFELARASAGAGTWARRLAIWFEPPGRAAARGEPEGAFVATGSHAPTLDRHDAPAPSRRLRAYVTANLVLAVTATFALSCWGRALPAPALASSAALVVLTVATSAGLVEHRPWARPLEAARFALIGLVLAAVLIARA
jgi:sterol desaturase/sphingolipid hydroxylase (fatty acid hydroxylase superfamily)